MTQAEVASRFYDRISGVYDALADASEREARTLGLSLLAPSGSERVLEIGFGTGHALVEIAKRLSDKGRVFGIDVSQGMLEIAEKRVQGADLEERIAELRLGDAKELPYKRDAFDAVFSSFTLELFSEAEIPVVLAEVSRVLRPGGRLGVVSMNATHESLAIVDLYRFLHRHFPHIVDCQPIDSRVSLWLLSASSTVTSGRARCTPSAFEYLTFILRADNRGEGGVIALTALVDQAHLSPKGRAIFLLLVRSSWSSPGPRRSLRISVTSAGGRSGEPGFWSRSRPSCAITLARAHCFSTTRRLPITRFTPWHLSGRSYRWSFWRPPRRSSPRRRWRRLAAGLPTALFLIVDLAFFSANVSKILHDQVASLVIESPDVPRVPREEKVEVQNLGRGFYRMVGRFGFMEEPNVPYVLALANEEGLDFKLEEVSFFLGRERLLSARRPSLPRWRRSLFSILSRNALGATSFFRIPPGQVIELGTQIEL